jgi:hypothetical protein
LIHLAAIKEHLAFEKMEEQLKHKRVIAFLLLGLLYKKEARAREAYAEVLEAQEKALHHPKVEPTVTTITTKPIDFDALSVLAYSSANNALENKLKDLLHHAALIEKKIATNEKQHLISQATFKAIDEELDKNKAFGTDKPLHDLREDERDEIYRKADEIAELDETKPNNTLIIQEKRDIIQALLEANMAKGIRCDHLAEHLAVLKDENVIYKANGEKALTFDEADYIFERDKELVSKGGKLYLINKGENLNQMPIEEQEKAAKRFKEISNEEAMSIKSLKDQYHRQDTNEYNGHKNSLLIENDQSQQDLISVANQLSAIQAAMSSAQLALNKTPTPLKMNPAPSTAQYSNEGYEHPLKLTRPNPTEQSINRLSAVLRRADFSPELKKEINSLKPGVPIQAQIMNRLLAIKDFGTNWLDVRKPDRETMDTNSPVAPNKTPTAFSINPLKGG